MIPSSSGVLYVEHKQCLLSVNSHYIYCWAGHWAGRWEGGRERGRKEQRREGGLISPSRDSEFGGEVKLRNNEKIKKQQ